MMKKVILLVLAFGFLPVCGRSMAVIQVPVHNSLEIQAEAMDENGIETVRFFVDGVLIGVGTFDESIDRWTTVWDTAGMPEGSHDITAEAEDPAGNVGTSAPVNVVIDNTAPILSIFLELL